MNRSAITKYIFHVLLSLGVSGILIAFLIRGSISSADPSIWPWLVATLTAVSPVYVLLYLLAALFRTVLRTFRYRMLLGTSEVNPPVFRHLFLVTVCRNMFVDMLPARLGELSYIAMLNRGYSVSARSCLSSLAISFVFDLIALGMMIAAIVAYQALTIGVQSWIVATLLVLGAVIVILLAILFPVLEYTAATLSRMPLFNRGILYRLTALLRETVTALRQTREAGIIGRVLVLSLGIRIGKYVGLYLLFAGVVAANFPEVNTHPVSALISLISAEASASLPVPTFMGFGTYEAGGTLAMVSLGAGRAASLIIMLSLHILSQVVDYTLGGTALIIFFLTTGFSAEKYISPVRTVRYRFVVFVLFCAGILVLAYQFRDLRKMGPLRPPDQGKAVENSRVPITSAGINLDELKGFVVWSSNRYGNHDILMFSLPGRQITRLTTDPHTEYFPRISPDGKQVVFARSQQLWVPQRNYYAWDIYLLDIAGGTERLLARNGNVPTWSGDGKKVYFQRNGNQVVELEVASGRESVLFQTGGNIPVPGEVILETPSVSSSAELLAATLRGAMRQTAVVDMKGTVRKVGNGCQLTWGPSDRYLYTVDHGGKQQNLIYKVDPQTLEQRPWFDSPGEFSHEYFPRVSNTGTVLVYGASKGGHEHDTADYEIFLWKIGSPPESAMRLTFHTGNDCWPDIYLF
jgi:hypothetical protein